MIKPEWEILFHYLLLRRLSGICPGSETTTIITVGLNIFLRASKMVNCAGGKMSL